MDTEYIAPYSIRAGVETIRHSPQLHNLLNFSPALPTLTFYGPPSPRFARFCDTRIFTIRHIILVSKEHAKHNLKGFNVNCFLILLPHYGVYKTEINLPSKVTVSIVTRFVMPNRPRWKNKKKKKKKKAIWSFNSWTLLSSSFLVLNFWVYGWNPKLWPLLLFQWKLLRFVSLFVALWKLKLLNYELKKLLTYETNPRSANIWREAIEVQCS